MRYEMKNKLRNDIVDCLSITFYLILLIMMFAVSDDADAATSCRSTTVKHTFDKQQGYPNGRKNYVVDHICALAQGGIDAPANMQYQTPAESIAKDRVENTAAGKKLFCTPKNSTPTRQVFNCKNKTTIKK